jgi:hypothetical protein
MPKKPIDLTPHKLVLLLAAFLALTCAFMLAWGGAL